MISRIWTPALIFCWTAIGTPLVAQAQAQPQAQDHPQVRALVAEAVAEYEARRYQEARALFRRAYDMAPSARTLRGIGMASFELREYVQAMRALQAALAEQRRPLTAEQRKHVEGLMERTAAFVGRFTISLAPKEAILKVDGQVPDLEPDGTLLLSFGVHTASAEAPGHTPQGRELKVIGGETQELVFHLRSVETGAVPVAGMAAGTGAGAGGASPPPPADDEEAGASGATWWFVGAGALAVGAAGATLWWLQRNSEIDLCSAAGSACRNADTLTRERNFAIGATVGLAAGAVALAVVGVVVRSKNLQTESGTTVACLPGPGTVHCALRF
jgi:hypothetical protein